MQWSIFQRQIQAGSNCITCPQSVRALSKFCHHSQNSAMQLKASFDRAAEKAGWEAGQGLPPLLQELPACWAAQPWSLPALPCLCLALDLAGLDHDHQLQPPGSASALCHGGWFAQQSLPGWPPLVTALLFLGTLGPCPCQGGCCLACSDLTSSSPLAFP